jgi:hypothetical protein
MKNFAFILLITLSFSCSACRFQTEDDAEVRNVVKAGGGYQLSEKQCMLLNDNGLSLTVSGTAGVLRGVSIGWARITLTDFKTHVTSTLSHVSTNVNVGDASQDTANQLLYDSITKAIAEFNFEAAAKEINGFRAKAKAAR